MKIGLIAHGALSIPPTGWGAVEVTIWWKKQYLERLGHSVDIANTRSIHDVIHVANRLRYDFVHCHSEFFVLECIAHLRRPFAITSHCGGLHRYNPEATDRHGGFHYLFEDTLRAPANIVLSDHIRDLYLRSGYTNLLRVLRNPVEAENFRVAPQGNGRAICLGLVCPRKRQGWLAEIARDRVSVDFVGPRGTDRDTGFAEHATAKYLGVWDKTTLYEQLTSYSCLVLLSESEAAPKVVLEALAAGVSVVISEACAANLTDEDFITVIPDGETRQDVIAHAIQTAIDRNASQRDRIRQYAMERFDFAVVINEYVDIIEEVREYFQKQSR
jgi:glycosyltransferase involved in cell wall biosynthesis